MNFDDEEAAIAEAIRLSLTESQPRSHPTLQTDAGSSSSAPVRLLPQVIDLTDDVKIEDTRTVVASPKVVPSDNDHINHGSSNEEDEQLKWALALSLEGSSSSSKPPCPVDLEHAPETPLVFDKAASTLPVLNGSSRADMERERQERIKRRSVSAGTLKASEENEDRMKKQRLVGRPITPEPIPLSTAISAPKILSASSSGSVLKASSFLASETSIPSTTATKPRKSLVPKPREPSSPAPAAPPLSPASHPMSALQYPPQYNVATFRNTYIQGTQPGKWEIRFQDLVKKEYLVKAVLASFMLDESWLEKHLPRSIPQLLIQNWSKEQGDKPGYCTEGKVTYLHPPLNGYGTFHPKLMLLFYPTFCRVVVSSANLVPHDWLQLVNTVFVQDFALLPASVPSLENLGEFGSTLYNFLRVMTVPDKVLAVLNCVDFKPAKVLLIPSVQGSFPVAAQHNYGIAQLAKALKTKTDQSQDMEIEYQTSSLGKLNLRFLSEFHRASKGQPVRARSRINVDERMPDIKIVFPTERHVQNSRLGELGAGTVCFQDQYWADPTYPRRVMHDFECVGALRGSLMHSKIVLAKAIPQPNTIERSASAPGTTAAGCEGGAKCAGWLYVGSANFTESAWGSVTSRKATAKSEGGLFIQMRNWEVGIVYVIETEEEMEAMADLARTQGTEHATDGSIQSFFGPLPVPYRRPLTPYTSSDRPWIR
ncbi:tyrosyl-DNA phosphodiesterase-domain-containing protein [Dissophora ornata]|nr:hypothetical protein BGZ58_000985 [Dissophora ornata]KAI8605589.1 tyrosyl-DNA phosphodiesterase-domain-containing protein [Dissophora ornata]